MEKLRQFEKPTGFRDFPPSMAVKKRLVEQRVQTCFERWGYREVLTPTLEYFDTVGAASAIPEYKMFKLIDREGKTLVLRPDLTAPIARMVSSVLKEEPLPLRLFYHANVFRAQDDSARTVEFFQSGVELVGDPSPEADAEVIALAVEALSACEISPFQLAVGHVELLDGLLHERVKDPQVVDQLKECLGVRDLVGYQERVARLNLSPEQEELLLLLSRQRGGKEWIESLRPQVRSPRVEAAIRHLVEMWEVLEDFGASRHVVLDLSLVGSIHYYTGVYFEGYALPSSFPLVSGGRYDRLPERFGRPTPATGFALKTDRVMEASPAADQGRERVALVYPRAARRAAIRRAQELRAEGKAVILHAADDPDRPPEIDADRIIRWGEGEDERDG
jgi:ATP phosphoribosyltransferase regulatory subunit